MGRKLRFCVAVLTLLILVAVPGAEAAKKKKKKASKPTQQTTQAVNPVGDYVRKGGRKEDGWITVRWDNKEKNLITTKVHTFFVDEDSPRPFVDGFEGTAKLQSNRAEFYDKDRDRNLVFIFKGNRLEVDSGPGGPVGSLYGTYYRQQKSKTKK